MRLVQSMINRISVLRLWLLSRPFFVKFVISVVVLGLLFITLKLKNQSQKPKYRTARVEKGTLVVSVTGSGQVSAVNSTSISTKATGVVSSVYVKDGDKVKAGDKIAEIDLDLDSKQNATQTLANYQSAQSNLAAAKANLYSTQSDMFTNWDKFMTIAQNSTYQNSDGTPNNTNRALPEFHIADDNWLVTEAKYKNQQNVVAQAMTAISAALYAYQQISPIVYAPISGTISGLSLQPGFVIIASQASSQNNSTTLSNTKIASIKTNALPLISVNLTEIDMPKIQIGNKATITLDSIPGKTYTGSVISIDTVGMVSSGVTTYPTFIKLDTESPDIFPNMSAQANIITQIKDNVLLVPTSAIQNQNDQSTIRTMKNGNVQEVIIETGLTSDTQAEITSGLSEGDSIVTSVVSPTETGQRTGQTQSPFSPFGGGGFRGGGFVGGSGGRR